MDELQLRLPTYKVGLIADAIERDISTRPQEETNPELPQLLSWLRYRIARRVNTLAGWPPYRGPAATEATDG